MVSGWIPFKIVSDSPALHSRWLLLLKIEMSSIVHCCFSISQNFFLKYVCYKQQEYFSIDCYIIFSKLLPIPVQLLYWTAKEMSKYQTALFSNYNNEYRKVIFSFICMFCWSLFVLLYFFFWPLCCLFFFDIRILIAPLVSSNSSFKQINITSAGENKVFSIYL
jgi:hypothetical protein